MESVDGRIKSSRRSITEIDNAKSNKSLQEALPKQWESLKAMKSLIADFKQTTAQHAVDHNTIEEWINVTLNESEDLQGIPEQAIKRDSRTALSRYGLD